MRATLSRDQITAVVEQVVARLTAEGNGAVAAAQSSAGYQGVFTRMDDACQAAHDAAAALRAQSLERRTRIIAEMRRAAHEIVPAIAQMAVDESGLGRAEDKVIKNRLVIDKTPGPEILRTAACTGDHGLMLTERAPYGVIGSITPCTNPTETILCNAIGMVAGGNAVVFNAHPSATAVSLFTIDVLNRAIQRAGGPANVLTSVAEPTIPTAQALMRHPAVRLLVVTGGPGVVREAMNSDKKVIAAGPGNPPAVVDETADLPSAAQFLIEGCTTDNNIICVAEKEILAVDSIADDLKAELKAISAVELTEAQIDAITQVVVTEPPSPDNPHGAINRAWVGRDACCLLREIGVDAGHDLRMILAEVPFEHPLVQMELMMPLIPLVRVPDVDTAIDLAVEAEHGFGHTAVMHSRNIDSLSRMAAVINTSIFVKNGSSLSGLGYRGEGYTSFTIASPTGEGLTTAVHFTRERRCTLKDHFRIV